EVLIFNPDAAQESSAGVLPRPRHIEDQAAHLAKKFAAHVIKLVVLFVESIGINENHLQKAVRQELHRETEEVSDGAENLLALVLGFVQGHQADTLRKVRASQKIFVPGRHLPQILVGLEILN